MEYIGALRVLVPNGRVVYAGDSEYISCFWFRSAKNGFYCNWYQRLNNSRNCIWVFV